MRKIAGSKPRFFFFFFFFMNISPVPFFNFYEYVNILSFLRRVSVFTDITCSTIFHSVLTLYMF